MTRTFAPKRKHTLAIKKIVLTCFFIGIFSMVLTAQNAITGKVIDSSGNGIIGVSILIKGTSTGTSTKEDGSFSLTTNLNSGIIVASYIGYQAKEVKFKANETVTITLTQQIAAAGDAVVVIGYGTARKKDLTGAVATVTSKDFGNNSVTQPAQLLQGKVSGVQVINNSGTPGSGANIVIRGTGSFTSTSPLYVIDGIQSDAGLFNAINPNDVESMTVLKDAASTAIYGANAANGVVIITTKRGKTGKPRININSQWGSARRPKELSLLNTAQFVDYAKEYLGGTLPQKLTSPDILKTNTNWQDVIFKNALVSSNGLSISGGTENVIYNLSAGYIDQTAVIDDYHYRAANFRISLEEKLGIFKFGQALNMQFQRNTGNIEGKASSVSVIPEAIYMLPYLGVYDPNNLGGFSYGSTRAALPDPANANSPVAMHRTRETTRRSYLLNPQLFGEVQLIKSLRVRSQFTMSIGGNEYSNFQQPYNDGGDLYTPRNSTENLSNYNWYLWENYAAWKQSFGEHKLDAVIGTSYKNLGRAPYVNFTTQDDNLPNNIIQNPGPATNGYGSAGVRDGNDHVTISYFGRINYIFDDRFILTASLRRDGSSVFGTNNKFGNFPGFGLSWNVVDEKFMKNIPQISDLKVRVNWGKTGNSLISAYQTSPFTYSGSPSGNLVYSFGPGESFFSGATINTISNNNLKWEATTQTNAGFDLGLLSNKLNLTFDWYDRKNSDLLVAIPIPNSTGTGGVGGGSSIAANAATARNRGVELSISYRDKTVGGLQYNFSVNGGYNNNKVLSLGAGIEAPIRAGTFDFGGYGKSTAAATYTGPGYAIGSFWGKVIDHVAIDQADVDKYNAIARQKTGNSSAVYQDGLLPGDYIFKDIDGNGTVDDNDATYLGNPNPKFTYGASFNLSYKNFDFNFAGTGLAGLKIYNQLNFLLRGTAGLHNVSTDLLDRWKTSGDIAKYPKAGQNTANNLQPSSFYIEDGGFFRVRMLTLGYTLTQKMLKNISNGIVSSVRVYVAAENMFTFTKYSGYDPEVSTPTGDFIRTRGADMGQPFQPKTVSVGIQIGL